MNVMVKPVSEEQSIQRRVDLASDTLQSRWDAFVKASAEGSFFHLYAWSNVIRRTYGHKPLYLYSEDSDGQLTGILPLVLVKSPFFGRSLISTAFTVGGGLIASDNASRQALVTRAQEIAAQEKVEYVELRGGEKPAGWESKSEVYAGFVSDIPADADENLKRIPRKKRADLRKAIKKVESGEMELEVTKQTGEFYQLYAESVRNLGTPVWPEKLVRNILKAFPEDTEVLVVKASGQPVAALVSFYHGDTVLPYYAGAGIAARKLHAYDYLYWEQMRRAHDQGYSRFDFGRSKVGTGAFAYKTHWGFEPEPLTYHYYLENADTVPDINPNNPKFRLITRAWQKLPLPLANRLGPVLAGNLA
ncbi:FemAB family XrtA/PEP-CTERM system-associated protein [Parvularcula sp. IMCC14364]|uniref:FemAB family XrtA/PEP-CTERM system-associated protein n=1 Tax=Parvularcula sp. IMCC14364 TaxID=3067902 RepID=UPI002740FB80|nr:FemAB family XrtA/PEP-CTERM system-associated protein [Parvularcula sp. IMCC14364]